MTTATISKDFEFSSSHVLTGLPPVHPCARMHGHNYVVRVIITGEVVEPGFVVDYRKLSSFKEYLDGNLDHRHLNDVLAINPTAENLAAALRLRLVGLLRPHGNVTAVSVSVSETPKTWATVSA